MKRLPTSCTDDEIKVLVVEWNELLAAEKYQEALDMFAHCDVESMWSRRGRGNSCEKPLKDTAVLDDQ